MALLTLDQRKAIFKELGLEYNEATIKALQSKYMLRKKDVDGIYGTNTDNMLRTVWNTLRLTKNFDPKEFRCDCGGRHCCGFPSYMKANELKHIQAIRDHWGRPITVTQGLRCKGRNKELKGSAVNSGHMYGRAVDFYQKGVTDTLANRKVSIKWIKKQFAHKYSYGNGIDSSGYKYNAPYMGNCLHTETTGDNMADIPAVKTPQPYSGAYPNTTVTETVSVEQGSKIAAKAKEYAWPKGTAESKTDYDTGAAKDVYKTALKKYMKKSAKISQSDCGYFVNTCVMASGVASSFKALPAKASNAYPAIPNTMILVHSGAMGSFTPKAGDVIRYRKSSGQHTVLNLGNGLIAHAGRSNWFPKIVASRPWNNDNVKSSTIQVLRAKPKTETITRSYLKKGDSGEEVKKLQAYINWLFDKAVLTVDGKFGSNSESYVKQMQTKFSLTADGLVGPKTVEAMKGWRQ